MADLNDPAIQQAFRDFARQLDRFGASIGGASSAASNSLTNFGSNLRTVGQGMARLRNDMDSGRRTYADSVQVYRRLKEDFEALDDATRATAAGQRIREAQNVMANQLVRQNLGELAGEIAKIGLTGALTFYKNQLTTAVQSLQENVGGMQLAFNLQQQAVVDLYSNFDKVGKAVTAAGVGLALINPAAGAVVAGVGLLGSQIAGIFGELEEKTLAALQREFNKTSSAFKSITNVGVLFGRGLTEMREQARLTQLDLSDYSKVVSANSADLAKLGGTVENGAKRFALVNNELIRYRQGLLNLGISEAEQAQATIDYMSLLQDVGKLQSKTNQQLAAETNDYLKNLRAISVITGEDAKKAQQRARDASMQAAVNNKLSMAGEGAATKFRALIAQFPGLEKGISQLYTLGTVVDPIQAQILAAMPGLDKVLKYNVSQLEKPGESLDQYNINLQESLRQNATLIRDQGRAVQGTFGMINMANGNLAELATLSTQYSIFGEKLITKADYFGEQNVMILSDTMDKLTKETSRSQVLFNQFNALLSSVLDGPLTDFAVKTPQIIERSAEKIVDSYKALLETHTIILKIDENFDKAITDAVGAALRASGIRYEEQRMAQGGIVSGPTRILAGEAGPEAIVPLSGGRSIPVDIKIDENIAVKEFNNSLATVVNQLRAQDVVTQNNVFASELKSSLANAMDQFGQLRSQDLVNQSNLLVTEFNSSLVAAIGQLQDLNPVNQSSAVQMMPVEVKVNESSIAKEFSSSLVSAIGQLKEQDFDKQTNLLRSLQTKNDTDYRASTAFQETFANDFSKAVLDLKAQIASDNDKQIGIMQQQIDKLDSLITHMRENVQASENIAHVLS